MNARLTLLFFAVCMLCSRVAFAQDEPPPRVTITLGGQQDPFPGALQTLNAPPGPETPPAGNGIEIFPDASRVWMTVRETDPIPVESARRGVTKWLCSSGQCALNPKELGPSAVGNDMLRSIKLQTPTLPLPLTIWGRLDSRGVRVLDFDPVLLARRSYQHVCAYPPPAAEKKDAAAPPKKPEKVGLCNDGPIAPPSADSGELLLGLEWPRQSELASFHYLAIVDSCGNARVQPFARTFVVPVYEIASGGCGQADGKVLKIFPQGGWIRVTAFNLDAPAIGNVVNATYRVNVPPLENNVESTPSRLLFPDPLLSDLQIDCGPGMPKAKPDAQAAPQGPPPGAVRPNPAPSPPEDAPPPPPSAGPPPTPTTPPTQSATPPPPKPEPPPPQPRPPPPKVEDNPATPGSQPLANEALVIAPEPLRQGRCTIRLTGQTKRRLVAPLALHVSLTRTDKTVNGAPIELLQKGYWIITPGAAEFPLPPLTTEHFDGDSRLRLTVSSDPESPSGKVVLLSDAGRVAASLRALEGGGSDPDRARRVIGSVVIHSVPICGKDNFQTLENAGSCIRGYLTFPVVFALLQVTRAPWVERPLVTKSTPLAAVGLALAIDSYNPVERKAFPIALQLGGLYENLGQGRSGLLGYLGIAPTIPILGEGGNTTTVGLIGGAGIEYITNETGPNEGLKPAAFLGAAIQIGQASPSLGGSGRASVGP